MIDLWPIVRPVRILSFRSHLLVPPSTRGANRNSKTQRPTRVVITLLKPLQKPRTTILLQVYITRTVELNPTVIFVDYEYIYVATSVRGATSAGANEHDRRGIRHPQKGQSIQHRRSLYLCCSVHIKASIRDSISSMKPSSSVEYTPFTRLPQRSQKVVTLPLPAPRKNRHFPAPPVPSAVPSIPIHVTPLPNACAISPHKSAPIRRLRQGSCNYTHISAIIAHGRGVPCGRPVATDTRPVDPARPPCPTPPPGATHVPRIAPARITE